MFPDVLVSWSISSIITAMARIRSMAESSNVSMFHLVLIWMLFVYRFDELGVCILFYDC